MVLFKSFILEGWSYKVAKIFNLTNMSSLPFAVSISGSNPAWIEPFSTVPFKVETDTVELTVMNMWCGEDKHPVLNKFLL